MTIHTTAKRAAPPRVLWSVDDIANLRAKAAHPRMAEPLAACLRRCEQYADPSHDAYLDPAGDRAAIMGEGNWGGTLYHKFSDLLTATLLQEDPRWPEMLCTALRTVAHGEPRTRATILGSGGPEIKGKGDVPERILLSSLCGMAGLALDMVRDRLSDEQRAAVTSYLRRFVVEPFKQLYIDPDSFRPTGLGVNIVWWDFPSWLMCFAAVYDPAEPGDREGMAVAADMIRRALHMGLDESGAIGEGPFYGSIDTHAWLLGAEILHRSGVYPFWDREPGLDRMVHHYVHQLLPGRAELLNRNDSSLNPLLHESLVVLLLHAARRRDAVVQTAWDRLNQFHPFRRDFHGPLGVLGYLLWYQPDLEPTGAGDADWPRYQEGGKHGVHLIRSGWGDDDLFFSLYSAGRTPQTFIHQHNDAGHFTLYALGEAFSMDNGYGWYRGIHHSVLVPNDEEPPHDDTGHSCNTWQGGHNHAFTAGRALDHVAVDIAWQWRCFWNYRHALVVRAEGADPYVVLLDNVNRRSDWDVYRWQMLTHPEHRIELDPGDLRATVHGQRHRLEVAWVHERPEDYPRPHTLTLEQQRFKSIGLRHGNEKEHFSYDTYQRLDALLEGYTGVLLSALLPRREGQPPVAIRRLQGRFQVGLTIDHGDVIDTIAAAPIHRGIQLGDIDAEATLAWVRRDRSGKLIQAGAVDSYHLLVDGQTLQPHQGDAAALFETGLV